MSCSNLVCALAQCYKNLFDRWKAARTTNFAYFTDKTPTVIEAIGLWTQLQWYERCGTDTQDTILALQTLLAGENCNCTQSSDTQSVPVVPWAGITGTGGTASTFVFWTEATVPTGTDGNNGDIWLNTATGDLYKKAGGTWTLKDNLTGPAGSDGTGSEKIQVVAMDITQRATPASTVPTAVSYTMAVGNAYFDWEGDAMEFTFRVKLGVNANGKTLNLYYDGDSLLEWFTDDLVSSANCAVVVRMRIVRITNVTQHVTAWLERAGNPGDVYGPFYYTTYSKDLNSTKNVVLYGTNSESVAGDITGYETEVIVKKRETTLIPGGSASGANIYSQVFTATEGQTEFTVTDFTVTPYNNIHLNDVMQGPTYATVSGQKFTVSVALSAGDRLLITTGFGYQYPNA